jgi:hypothetical protein
LQVYRIGLSLMFMPMRNKGGRGYGTIWEP